MTTSRYRQERIGGAPVKTGFSASGGEVPAGDGVLVERLRELLAVGQLG